MAGKELGRVVGEDSLSIRTRIKGPPALTPPYHNTQPTEVLLLHQEVRYLPKAQLTCYKDHFHHRAPT